MSEEGLEEAQGCLSEDTGGASWVGEKGSSSGVWMEILRGFIVSRPPFEGDLFFLIMMVI